MNSNDFPSLLATGFVVDAPHEGTLFPSAGGNSSDARVQAVYWRCLVALFASARITNPAQRLALFSNVIPPEVDGIAIAEVLERYGVELRLVPLTTRLPAGRTAAWGNVLYFYDILASLQSEPDNLRFALIDSDVLVTAPLAPLWTLLDEGDFAGYVVDSSEDEPINGMTRRSMAQAAADLTGQHFAPLPHYGGELFATSVGAWKVNRGVFDQIREQAALGQGPAGGALTEEHIFSIAFALFDDRVAPANGVIKRIWTSPRHNTAQNGDEHLPLWHLPAEKRYGLTDLFVYLARQGFRTDIAVDEFRTVAGKFCAVPRRSFDKLVRDGVRQVAAKLGQVL